MRVALLTNFVAPYRIPLFRALADRVSALRIFVSTAMEHDRNWEPDWADLDVVVQRSRTLRRTWRHERFRQAYELHLPWDTLAQLRRFEPDVVLSGELGMRTALSLAYGRAAGVPVAIWATLTEHLEVSRGRVRRLVRPALVRGARRVIVNGESGARYVRSLGYPDEGIERVPQCIDPEPFLALPLSRPADAPLLHVGHVSELKGVELLLRALPRVGRPVHLVMVGDGPLRRRLEAMAHPDGVRVEWAGPVPYADLPAHYAGARALVFPTFGDEWGLVVNEALASGVPVMGSDHAQAVDELVRDGENGWRFRPDDEDAVAAAVRRVLDTPRDRLELMGAAARRSGAAITPEGTAERMVRVLESCRSGATGGEEVSCTS